MTRLAQFIDSIDKLKPGRCFVGFDGFVDEIVKAVAQRDGKQFTSFLNIGRFADRIASFAGKSGNIELVVDQRKIGGNAPILAQALVEGGHQVVLAAPLDDPIFESLTRRCKMTYSLGNPGKSTAIEFLDGKVIFGKMESHITLNAEEALKRIPDLQNALEESELFASVNWTMLPMMNALWQLLIQDILPNLSQKKRYFFVDLADPAKRSDSDLLEGFRLIKEMSRFYEVHVGLNLREAERAALVFNLATQQIEPVELAKTLKKAIGIDHLVIHSPLFACDGQNLIHTPFVEKPKLTTGAGDNFNGGYLNALLFGISGREALEFGVATASYYVRFGKSPSLEELALFLREWIN